MERTIRGAWGTQTVFSVAVNIGAMGSVRNGFHRPWNRAGTGAQAAIVRDRFSDSGE